ncbi:MAG: glycosyltransferase [Actinobacteria bacterium]|nr:glycosyltransferase [Actinomycetota bacterium]
MSRGDPTVTVVVPARDEAADIERCCRALVAQDHPHDDIEIVVVDGASDDDTAAIARRSLGTTFDRVEVVRNEVGATPANLNRGLAEARGRIVVRVDARSIVPPEYVRRLVETLDGDPTVAVAGGAQVASPRRSGAAAVGIARALNNRFTMGLSRYRRGGPSGPSDTVYLGSFRTDQLRSLGGWDERLPTNQDFDLNRRMATLGSVWFVGDLSVDYLPRASHADLWRQYVRFGGWKVRYWRTTGDRPQPRQLLALAVGPSALAAGLVLLVSPTPVRRAGLVAAVAGAVAVEAVGSSGPDGGLRARLASIAAIGCVSGGWSFGAWRALLGRDPS